MSQDKGGADVKDYIRDKIRSGKFLIKSIHQRQQTISNIAHEIVSRQKDFLEHGPSALKPMTMVQIADIVGVHETTVSRAISDSASNGASSGNFAQRSAVSVSQNANAGNEIGRSSGNAGPRQ